MFAPRGRRELQQAAAWIADENPEAAEGLLEAALRAAEMIVASPTLAHVRLALAPERYRFCSVRGYPFLLVVDAQHKPPVIARFVRQATDLPVVLDDLDP
jgi:plasmid stabilization system protein ParE